MTYHQPTGLKQPLPRLREPASRSRGARLHLGVRPVVWETSAFQNSKKSKLEGTKGEPYSYAKLCIASLFGQLFEVMLSWLWVCFPMLEPHSPHFRTRFSQGISQCGRRWHLLTTALRGNSSIETGISEESPQNLTMNPQQDDTAGTNKPQPFSVFMVFLLV